MPRELRVGCPWELIYADDLLIVAVQIDQLERRLEKWKEGLEDKGLKVNVRKTEVMCFRHDVPKIKIKSAKFPCAVFLRSVRVSSILYQPVKIGKKVL